MKGLDGLLYMSSTSEASGRATITLTFDNGDGSRHRAGAGPEQAAAGDAAAAASGAAAGRQRQQVAQRLPDDRGVHVRRRQHEPQRHLRLRHRQRGRSAEPRCRAWATCRSSARRTRCGSGSTRTSWTPTTSTTTDIVTAVQAQNAQVTVGQLGGTPAVEGQQLNATISAQERLQTAEQFREIVRAQQPGRLGAQARRRRSRRTRRRDLRVPEPLQRQAAARHGHFAGHRRQRAGNGQGRRRGPGAPDALLSGRV